MTPAASEPACQPDRRPAGRPPAAAPRITVIGEALIDLVPGAGPGEFRARTGGSPFNVAVGLARLAHPTTLMARLGENAFGRMLRTRADAEGIDLSAAPRADQATTLAVVSLDENAQASYDFYLEGTADWQWTTTELAQMPTDTSVVHFGSLASWTPPGSDLIGATVAARHDDGAVLVSYDPNIRPLLLRDPVIAVPLVESSIASAHLVKASQEDVEWLYPGRGIDDIATGWVALGADLVVITDGAEGAHAFRAGAGPVRRPGRAVHLVDTVGTGDSFTAGLLGALIRRDRYSPARLRSIEDAELSGALDDAILVSSLTCQRLGADPPHAVAARPEATPGALAPADLAYPV